MSPKNFDFERFLAACDESLKNSFEAIHYFPTLDSTQHALHRLGNTALPLLCIADLQTHGVGAGRNTQWHSFATQNITFSMSGRLPKTPGYPPLSIVCGLLLADFFRQTTALPVKLKWPNDLWLESKKLGGILIDTFYSADHYSFILGVGLNYVLTPIQQALLPQATSLWEHTQDLPSREELVSKLLNFLVPRVLDLDLARAQEYIKLWPEYDAFYNQKMRVQNMDGIDKGINTDGSLNLLTNNGIKRVYSTHIDIA